MNLVAGVVLVAVLIIVLFVLGVLRPRRSRQAQEKVKQVSAEGERRTANRAGWLGDRVSGLITTGRWLSEQAAHAGRVVHDKLFRSRHGQAQERTLLSSRESSEASSCPENDGRNVSRSGTRFPT